MFAAELPTRIELRKVELLIETECLKTECMEKSVHAAAQTCFVFCGAQQSRSMPLVSMNLAHLKLAGRYIDDEFLQASADKVRTSITALLEDVSSMTQQIHVKDTRVKVTETRLIPMFPGDFSSQVQLASNVWNVSERSTRRQRVRAATPSCIAQRRAESVIPPW